LNFTIDGQIVPYVRMTRRGKFVRPRAKRYLASKDRIGWQLKVQMQNCAMLPERTSLRAILSFELPAPHRCDIDNQIKAVLDAAQGIVYRDDRWIDAVTAVRCKSERHHTRLWVEAQ
jgi:Holliday junction resolvase RusA-like endonuclease